MWASFETMFSEARMRRAEGCRAPLDTEPHTHAWRGAPRAGKIQRSPQARRPAHELQGVRCGGACDLWQFTIATRALRALRAGVQGGALDHVVSGPAHPLHAAPAADGLPRRR
jgi:hypothetical protein